MPRSSLKYIKKNIHVQGDFVCYGYGGIYQAPKGWGMDIDYINRKDFKGFFARKRLKERIYKKAQELIENDKATQLFLPNFIRKLHHNNYNEWHYQKCQLMFVHFQGQDSMKRFDSFETFVRMCLGRKYAMMPDELERAVKREVSFSFKGDIEKAIQPHVYMLVERAQEVTKNIFMDTFGVRDGQQLFDTILDKFGGQLPIHAEAFQSSFFNNDVFYQTLWDWHRQRMQTLASEEIIDTILRKAEIKVNRDKKIRHARKDVFRALKDVNPDLMHLLRELDVPLFIATGSSANYFKNFFLGIPMCITKDSDELQPYTVFGLCMYQRFAKGGVIVTRGEREYEKFWHTLTEEISHLADGPKDRYYMAGHHRYSSNPQFSKAYQKDRDSITYWKRAETMGAREWQMLLSANRMPRRAAEKIKRQVELYDAALDFDHYRAEERAAEIFAALPVVEKAVGAKRVRKYMPHLFRFYDREYRLGLRQEVKELRQERLKREQTPSV